LFEGDEGGQMLKEEEARCEGGDGADDGVFRTRHEAGYWKALSDSASGGGGETHRMVAYVPAPVMVEEPLAHRSA
jgi:hypothetical protein